MHVRPGGEIRNHSFQGGIGGARPMRGASTTVLAAGQDVVVGGHWLLSSQSQGRYTRGAIFGPLDTGGCADPTPGSCTFHTKSLLPRYP